MNRLFLVSYWLLVLVGAILAQQPIEVDGFQHPLNSESTQTCEFGVYGECFYSDQYHLADDFGDVSVNDPVYASARGIVREAQWHNGYGGTVLIEHRLTSNTYAVSLYAHLNNQTLVVNTNDIVERGDLIGYIAKKGNVPDGNGGNYKPHLHFGLHKHSYSQTPIYACDGEWSYHGYTSDPCDLLEWYNPSDFFKVGFYSDGWHTDGTSQAILDRFIQSDNEGYSLGSPADNGPFDYYVHTQSGVTLQDFFGENTNFYHGYTAVIVDPNNNNEAHLLKEGFWQIYMERVNGLSSLGAASTDEYVFAGYTKQDFQSGYMTFDQFGNDKVRAYDNQDNLLYVENGFFIAAAHDEGGSTGDLRVVFPNGGETLIPEGGYAYNILWNGSEASSVQIELSRDNGSTWTTIVYYSNSGSYYWEDPPGPASDECLIRITNLQNTSEYDVSNYTFTIGNPNDPPIAQSFSESTPYPDTLFIDLNGKVTDNDGDVEWNTLAITGVTNGTATVDVANKGINFIPLFGYFGSAAVRYKVKDDDMEYSNEAIVSIDVYVVTSDFTNGDFENGMTSWSVHATDPPGASVSYKAINIYGESIFYSNVLGVYSPGSYGRPPDTVIISQPGLHFTSGSHTVDFLGYSATRNTSVTMELYSTIGTPALLASQTVAVGDRLYWDRYSVSFTLNDPVVETEMKFLYRYQARLDGTCRMDDLEIDPGLAKTGAIKFEPIIIVLDEFALYQNYPNPFNPSTVIRYALPQAGLVKIVIYDLLGQEIRELVNGYQEPGYQQVVWDSRNNQGNKVTSGIYLYQLSADKFIQTNKLILLR